MQAIKNGIWNAGASVIGIISGFIGSVFVVRNLTPDIYGELSYYLWLIGILSTLGSLAFPNSLTKIRSELLGQKKYEEQEQLTIYIFLLLFCVNLGITVFFFIWAFTKHTSNLIIFIIIGTTILPNVITSLMKSTLWGIEAYKPVSVSIAFGSIFQLVCILLATWMNPTLNNYLLCLSVPIFIQFFLLIAYFLFGKKNSINRKVFKRPSKETIILYVQYLIPSTLIMIYLAVVWQRSEIFFLNRYSVKSELGFYNVGFTMYAIFSELGWGLVQGYYPRLSSLFGSKSWEAIKHEFSQGLVFSAIYAIPVCLGGFVVIGKLLPLVYGQNMTSAILPARILYLGMVPAVVTGIFNIALSALGGVWLLAFNGLAVSIFNILIDIFLIPRYGAVGAALANTASQVVMFGILLVMVHWKLRLNIPWRPIVKLIAYGTLATFLLPSLVLRMINNPWLGLLFSIPLSVIVYGSLLLSSETFSSYLPKKVFQARKFLTVEQK